MGYFFVLGAILATSFGLIAYKKYALDNQIILLILTVFFFLMAPVLSFISLKYLSVDIVYMATSLNGFIVLFLSQYFLKEKVKQHKFIGALLVFIGVSIYMV